MTDRREMEEPPVRRLVWESPAAPEQTILRAREGIRFSLASCSHAESNASASTYKDADECIDAHGFRAAPLRSLARTGSYGAARSPNRLRLPMRPSTGMI